jgi:hypothetical protein
MAGGSTGGFRRWLGGATTLATFAIVGPLIGGAVILLALLALKAVPTPFAGDLPSAFFFSYATCFPPVLLVGVIIAVCDATARPVGATLASATGAACGVVWGLFLAGSGAVGTLSILAFVATIAATLLCWRLTRLIVPAP